jgi:hypothetical protein
MRRRDVDSARQWICAKWIRRHVPASAAGNAAPAPTRLARRPV